MLKIHLEDDFDPEKTAKSGQCFRVRRCENGFYRFITGKQVLYLRKEKEDTLELSCSRELWETVWFPYFDMSRNFRAIREAVPEEDPFLFRAAQYGAGLRILRQEPFETLVSFIISQRKNIPAISKAVETLAETYGSPIGLPDLPPEGEEKTLFAFPTPAQLAAATEEELRGLMLGYRAPYVRDAAEKAASGELDLTALGGLPEEELLEELMRVKGVGIKVAKCTALFAFGRLSLAPVDTWISKVIEQKYGGADPFARYGPSAGIMQQYAFFYAGTHRNEF